MPVFISFDEFVYKRGEYAEEIYFVLNGKINYFYHNDLKTLSSVLKSNYFGDIEVVMRTERMYSTRAERDTELLSMNKFLLNLIENEYPGVWKSIKNNAIANEIINKRAIIKIEEQQRLHSGKIDFFQYRKNIDHRVTVYKETIKKNLSLGSKKKKKISLEFIQKEIKIISSTISNLRDEIENIKTKKYLINKPDS